MKSCCQRLYFLFELGTTLTRKRFKKYPYWLSEIHPASYPEATGIKQQGAKLATHPQLVRGKKEKLGSVHPFPQTSWRRRLVKHSGALPYLTQSWKHENETVFKTAFICISCVETCDFHLRSEHMLMVCELLVADSDGGGGGGSGKEVAALTEKKMGRSLPPVNTITYTVSPSSVKMHQTILNFYTWFNIFVFI